MTLDVLRERILWSKREELTSAVLSRKRKLRELYAVACSPAPVPNHAPAVDGPPLDDGEASFLEANDILKGRFFDESTLPPRRRHAPLADNRSTEPIPVSPARVVPPAPLVDQTTHDGDEQPPVAGERPAAEEVTRPPADAVEEEKLDGEVVKAPSSPRKPSEPPEPGPQEKEAEARHRAPDDAVAVAVADSAAAVAPEPDGNGSQSHLDSNMPQPNSMATADHEAPGVDRVAEAPMVDALPSTTEPVVPNAPDPSVDPADAAVELLPDPVDDVACRPSKRRRVQWHGPKGKPVAVVLKKRPLSTGHTPEMARRETGGAHRRETASEADYMFPLFVAQAYSPPRAPTLNSLLASAHKTLNSSNFYVDFYEQLDGRILRRVYQLQFANRWSLRQVERCPEPPRQATHWDAVLDHMRWMRTDFREERKWKMTVARNMAQWCAEWVQSDPHDRLALQVRVRTPPVEARLQENPAPAPMLGMMCPAARVKLEHLKPAEPVVDVPDVAMTDAPGSSEIRPSGSVSQSAASLFALNPHEVELTLRKTITNDQILRELPLYEAAQTLSQDQPGRVPTPSETRWKTAIVPTSKYVQGQIARAEPSFPRKRSRYEYEEDDEDTKAEESRAVRQRLSVPTHSPAIHQTGRAQLTPELEEVALFNPMNKHIRDRIHAGHAFRPPSEFIMPSQTFYECRQPSQWTVLEEYELRTLVKQYSYNWSLISSLLSSSSLFSAGAERRTPWECFERWVSLEGLPADMQRTQYFRTYHARLEAAQHPGPQPQLQPTQSQPQPAQQPPAPGQTQSQPSQQTQPPQPPPTTQPEPSQNPQNPPPEADVVPDPPRRRSTQPIRVERRRQSRHLALFDAMRKLAKKRETTIQKQQQVAGMAAMRKANIEPTQTRASVHRPQDFSRLKYEREVKMQERAEAYRQQVLAQQRAALQQRSAQHAGVQPTVPNGTSQPQRNGTSGADGASNPPGPSFPSNSGQAAFPIPPRPQSSLQVPPNNVPTYANGASNVPPVSNMTNSMRMKPVPQAHMHPTLQGHQRPSAQATNDMRMLMETNRIQQEQRRFLQHQHQQQQQQQQQPGPLPFQGQRAHTQAGPSSSPVMNSVKSLSGPSSMPSHPAVLAAAMQAASSANGLMKPAPNSLSAAGGPSPSAQMSQNPHLHPSQPQSLSNGMVPAINTISHQIKARNPNASPEQIKKMTNEQLAAQYQHRISQSAMNAAAGALGGLPLGVPNGSGGLPNQQLYAQMIRAQQASQSKAGVPPPNGHRPPSRSVTPQTQRPPNVQATPGQNQSPRPPQAQIAGGQ